MTGKSVEKLLRKLRSRKYRWQMQLFVAEGKKVVEELISSGLKVEKILTSLEVSVLPDAEVVSNKVMSQLSNLESGGDVLGIFHFPKFNKRPSNRVLILDRLNDPGNVGTIVRTCDWFGIDRIYCVKGTADAYNAKSIQSSMGSIGRVELIYDDDENIFHALQDYDLYCADLDGENLFETSWDAEKTALVMGSESHGPSPFWKQKAKAISIPRAKNSQTESLNVAMACGIILANMSAIK